MNGYRRNKPQRNCQPCLSLISSPYPVSILHLQREYLKKLGQSIGMFTNLCLLLRLPLADAVFSSVTCSEIHFLSPCNLCCYLQVVLYKLKPRARFHCRFTSHTRFVGQKTESGKWSTIAQIGRQHNTVTSCIQTPLCFSQSEHASCRNFI